MTAAQQAERDGIDLEAANKRLAAMGMQQAEQQDGTPSVEQQKAYIAAHTPTPAAAPKPARAKPVKGLCACGKHYSRHIAMDGFRWCNANHDSTFALAPEAPAPPATPAPAVPGALTEAQAERIRTLMIEKQEADLQASESMDAAREAGNRFNEYLRSLTRS